MMKIQLFKYLLSIFSTKQSVIDKKYLNTYQKPRLQPGAMIVTPRQILKKKPMV